MANPFGNGDQDKRPTQTIEGTATEVAVEPTPGQESRATGGQESDGASEKGESRQSQSAPPPKASRPRAKSLMTHLAAGLFGGIVAVIALALAWSDLVTDTAPVPSSAVAALEQRLARLEQAAPVPSSAVAALEQRLAKLEQAPPSSFVANVLSHLDGRVGALEQRLARLGQAPPSSFVANVLSHLDGRVGALENSQQANAAQLSELANNISQLRASLQALSKIAEQGGSVAAAAVGQQIAEAEKRLDAKIAAALAKGGSASAEHIQQLEGAITELRAKLGALAEAMLVADDASALQPELAALAERIAKLEATLPELAGAIEKEAAGAKSAALAIAFANLRAAVSDGRRYAAELDTLGALGPALGDFGILPAYAETGIPTLSELARSFTAVSDEALAAAAPEPDGSLVDNLMTSAQSLVKIKRIDDAPEGDGASAVLARAKAALDNGDLAAAVTHIESLDAPAREAFAAWLGQARARLSAGDVLTRLEGALLISMSGEAEANEP